jgi:hypothetical protein
VKFGKSNSIKISTDRLEDVDDLLNSSMEKYNTLGDPLPLGSKSLYLDENVKDPLEVDQALSEIYNEQIQVNSAKNPLIIKVEGHDDEGKCNTCSV